MVQSITLGTGDQSVTLTPDQWERGVTRMTGGAAYTSIPSEEDFEDGDWLPAADLEKIADRLIETKPDLQHLYDFKTVYFWKRTGGKTGGRPTMGTCRRVTGALKALAPGADFMVWLAADHCREHELTAYQAEAYLFHELMHTQADEKGRPRLRPHDFVGFEAEVREYGLYDAMMQAAGAAFQQLRLDAVA